VSRRPWTIEDGDLTPTMKIRRSSLEGSFQPHLEQWYQQSSDVVWQ
jgi:long-subunit acyl-CoA synthetase (AMP-forming)